MVNRARIFAAALLLACNAGELYLHAEESSEKAARAAVDESSYQKAIIPIYDNYPDLDGYEGEYEMPVLLDKATGKVTYYWAGSRKGWVDPGGQQKQLQDLYDNRKEIKSEHQLKQMQDEMDRMDREDMGRGMSEELGRR